MVIQLVNLVAVKVCQYEELLRSVQAYNFRTAAPAVFVANVIIVLVAIIINAPFVVCIACATSIPGIVIVVAAVMATPVIALFTTVATFVVTIAAIFMNFGSADGFSIPFAAVITLLVVFIVIFGFALWFWGNPVNLDDAGCYGPSSVHPHLMNITS
jgi:hypothetical protein